MGSHVSRGSSKHPAIEFVDYKLDPGNRPDWPCKRIDMKVRVNIDKILEIDQIKETFKMQLFFEGRATVPKEEKEEWLNFFQQFTLQEELASPGRLQSASPKQKPSRLTIENLVTSLDGAGNSCVEESPKAGGNKVDLSLKWLIRGEFGESLELHNFPFDCQDFSITMRFGVPCRPERRQVRLTNWEDDDQQPVSKIVLNVFSLENTWRRPHRLVLRSDFTKERASFKGDVFPLLHITVMMQRIFWFYMSNVVIPMFIIVTLSACSMVIPINHIGERLAASLTCVLTAVAFKYVVAQMVPIIGYDTWLDEYVLMCFVFLALIVLENCLAHAYQFSRATETKLGLWVYVGGFLSFNCYFFIRASLAFCRRSTKVSHQLATLDGDAGSSDSESSVFLPGNCV